MSIMHTYSYKTIDNCIVLYKRINSQWIKDLNVRPKTVRIKTSEENIGKKIYVSGFGIDFFNTKRSTGTNKNDTLYPDKLKASCTAWK